MSHIIDYIIDKTTDRAVRNRNRVKQMRKDYQGERADKRLKYCTDCEEIWEYNRYDRKVTSKYNIFYYSHVPSYKKHRELCPRCVKVPKWCDLCEEDKHRSEVTKDEGIWVCEPCNDKYPKNDTG
tara:strand:- start:1 stop:375 length:375 start_codon:yes stop_codon:yes gene_type:complete